MKKPFCNAVVDVSKKILKYFKKETEDEKITRLFKEAYARSKTCYHMRPNEEKLVERASRRVAAQMRETYYKNK